jgi:carboxypeptidase C (cathepsin A)
MNAENKTDRICLSNPAGRKDRGLDINPRLHVQVENGYFDLATPFFATEFTMEHLGLPEALQRNIKENYYNAGHMMYLHDQDRVSLHNQIASFVDRATQP